MYEELEEPFSPIVSEYNPTSDSDSDESIELNTRKGNRTSRKMGLIASICQTATEYEKEMKQYESELLKSPVVAYNIRQSFLNSVQVSDNVATPVLSPVYKNISTPDSFKDVLQLVQNRSKTSKNIDNSVCNVNPQSVILYKPQYSPKNIINKYMLPNPDLNYGKFRFVASTSIVYLEDDFNPNYSELESFDLISSEITDPTSIENNVSVSYNNTQSPIQSSTSMLTEPESRIKPAFIATQTTVYINDENVELPIPKRQSRKRIRDESSWQVNKNKKLKNSGKRYHSKATKKERNGKIMGDPCACKNKCNEKIDNAARMSAFEAYWKLGDHERQWDFILRYVKTKPTRVAVVNSNRPRTQTLIYSLPARNGRDLVTVCKKMFLQTLNINDRTVFTALMKQETQTITDLRGRHTNRQNKIHQDTTESVINHINLFPRKESHYLRKQTQREYLDEKLNCAKMYRLYVEWMKDNPVYLNVKVATERWYYHIFSTRFNIGFFHPKKDRCETCSLYEDADSERKEQLKTDYEQHVKNKELVRQIKDDEKKTSDPKTKTVACFDLEKVLSLPQSEVGVFHYKRKYPVYNFTIYNILTKSGYCYVWHAAIAKRGANEIASCLWSYLQGEAERGIKDISFYSDNCSGQNRNRFVFALYVHASLKLNIKVTHRFLQKGHTQNEGDSMHSCIEKSKKNHVLYVPEEIYAIIRNAKVGQRYNVKEMTQQDFIDFKKLVNNNSNWAKTICGEKINWTKIKEISVDPASPGKLHIRYEFDAETPIIVDTYRQNRGRRKKTAGSENIEGPYVLTQLYDGPLPISENLYKDLISLCRDNYIPPHYQTFYMNLRPQSAINEDDFDAIDSDSF